MSEKLRELRISQQLPAKSIVEVVRQLYPKYDKTLQSKCERSGEYGVELRQDAMDALCLEFAPEQLQAPKQKRDSGHLLKCRISCRLPDDDYQALKHHLKTDGYQTMQDWLKAVVTAYLHDKEADSHSAKGELHD